MGRARVTRPGGSSRARAGRRDAVRLAFAFASFGIADAALAECQGKGFHTSVAVVDRSGQPLVLLRDEQAGLHTLEMSRRKAYTARMFRTTTLEFQKRTEDPAYTAQREVTDMLALGGGVPILVGTEIIGGVGSSGSSQTQDDACAKAGIAKVADQLK